MLGVVCRFDVEEVRCAMNDMKYGKASEPCGVVLKMLKNGGQPCLNSLVDVFNDILSGASCKRNEC